MAIVQAARLQPYTCYVQGTTGIQKRKMDFSYSEKGTKSDKMEGVTR